MSSASRQQVETVTETDSAHEFLKICAYVFMVVDHIYWIHFPGHPEGRIVGRMALPIFLYLICQGYKRSRSPWKYAGRLASWGVFSQIVMMSLGVSNGLNILLMLSYCVVMLKTSAGKPWMVVLFSLGAELFNLEYGAYGVLACYLLQSLNIQKPDYWWSAKWVLLNLLVVISGRLGEVQIMAIYAPVIIWGASRMNFDVPRMPRDFWYLCYPMQWGVIKLLTVIA